MNRRALKRRLGVAVRGAQAVVALDFSPRPLPWSRLRDDHSVTGELRQHAVRLARESATSTAARAIHVVHGVYWPVRVTCEATVGVVKNGKRVRAASGAGRWAQWRDVMTMAHTMNYSPKSYYLYRFWDPAIRASASTYLQVHEFAMLLSHLNRNADHQMLVNKEQFDRACAAEGIAMPQMVATLWAPRSEGWSAAVGALPSCDVFLKPVWGEQGRGGERWLYDPRSERWSRRETILDHDELVAHFRSRAKRRAVLIQKCLENHPDIGRFSTGPLCTFRVMTFRDDVGRPQLLALTLKMARKGADVDNLHAGGLVAAVDGATGRLGPGITRDPTDEPRPEHPETREPIADARLTIHTDVIAMALASHDRLDAPWTVGWDVAMTPDGAVLVEGNSMWGIDLYHMPHAVGLETHFAEELLRRVRAA
ncbi:MAG: sugar-transfer associated ATP-grasp domain-containing protein [Acidimicrobiales bacterium]|nr:sugar-transfer associated ATP-grasp domain-containing protein [Acidimicrobiales bacterium]